MHAILHQLRRAALLSVGDGPSDTQLLEAFLSHRDELAFEALVRRHGPMVLAVCRRVTGNAHDAEDAFQATFLVLARKVASLRSRQLLPGWLYRIAYRTALNTRAMTRKRRAKEQQAALQPRAAPGYDVVPEELLARLDEALDRLPDRYRLPVVLCELQGHTRKQAAQQLGLPVGTVSWRLAHARKLLAQRLARYGTMLSAGAVTAVLSQSAASAVPATLVRAATMQALALGTVPAPIQALTEGVLKAMLLSKLKIVWAVALVAIVGTGAVGVMYRPAVAADPRQPGSGGAAAHASADELEELRLEIAALRKGLQATRQRVNRLEDEVATLRGRGADGLGGPGGGMQMRMQRRMQMRGGGGMGPPATQMMPGGGIGPHGMQPTPMGPAGNDRQNPGPGVFEQPLFPRFGDGGKPRLPQAHQAPGASPLLPRFGNSQTPDGPNPQQHQPTAKPDATPPGVNPGAEQKPPASNQQSGSGRSTSEAERLYLETLERARDAWAAQSHTLSRGHDPLAEAQAALKQLRNHPNDPRAADRLQQALKRLAAERQKQQRGPQPGGPGNQ